MNEVVIEWRHLEVDGETCSRCAATGKSIRDAMEILVRELEPIGWGVSLKEVVLPGDRIVESNLLLINGTRLEDLIPEANESQSSCDSCSELLNTAVCCRTITVGDNVLETIPTQIIIAAVHNLIDKQRSREVL